jgi:hypothetical protein
LAPEDGPVVTAKPDLLYSWERDPVLYKSWVGLEAHLDG